MSHRPQILLCFGSVGFSRMQTRHGLQTSAAEAEALVQAARSGDREAFDVLVRRYRSRVMALALHLTASASDADDVTQDVFVRAFRAIRHFRGRSDFFTWLYRITLNRASSCKRDRGRRPTVGLEDDRVRMAVAVDAPGDPRSALELRESYARLIGALDALSPTLRTTVVLVALQGLSYQEAAAVLGTSEGTIGWRVHEARRQLRRSLERAGTKGHEAARATTALRRAIEALSVDEALAELGAL